MTPAGIHDRHHTDLEETYVAQQWLFKEEPSAYNFERLIADGRTIWDGVRNNWALKNLREVRAGDQFLFYHTGKERAVVGIGEVVSDPYPDPELDDVRRAVVDVRPVRALRRPVTLDDIKRERSFAESPLVKIGRLSVVPVTYHQWRAIERLEKA